MLPGPDSIKFIRCNCKTGTDAACKKKCSCRKNRLFCVMVCSQCHGEKCSNKSKSSIIYDIDGDNDRNVFDAIASFLQIKTDSFIATDFWILSIYKFNLLKTMFTVVIPYLVFGI